MSSLVAAAAVALAVVLVVVLPAVGVRRYAAITAPDVTPARRQALLRRSAAVKWAVAALALVICWAAPFEIVWWPSVIGVPVILVLVAGLVASSVLLVRVHRSPESQGDLGRAASRFSAILPRTDGERWAFAGFAVTAGVTEEIAYRAFLIAVIAWLVPMPLVAAGAVAGVAFGLTHLYQGWRGVLGTGAIGIVFGLAYPSVGLVALVVVHTLFDLRLLLLPAGFADGWDEPVTEAVDPDPAPS